MPRSLTSRLGIIVGIALAFTALLPLSTASADRGQCPRGYFCAWEDDSFSGSIMRWEGSDANWHTGSSHWIADDAESVFNNGVAVSPDIVRLYLDINYGGYDLCVRRGDWFDASMDDNDYSSHKWTNAC
ncbi:peptidase inhibitor family I36 protein [Nocardioides speluncae]|uniref:peptidase inhibitor family I36 protein n=1 Tax=Nocardioides speluncae TaxID=2670337 RepID=UPI000D694495|nr:peptidase inhibitor family I36 protein [Nocardioides speluncae]